MRSASSGPSPLKRSYRELALFVLAVGLCLAAQWASLAPRAEANVVGGLQTHTLWAEYGSEDMSGELDRAKDAGAGIIRVDLGWATLEEQGKRQFTGWYLSRMDELAVAARARGLKLLVTVTDSPCWASSAPESLKQGCAGAWWERGVQRYAPSDPEDYADALRFLVARYGSSVAGWEIWNEPNHPQYLKAADRAVTYAAILKAAYRAVKLVDPYAVVVGGALSEADYRFTERLYDLGVRGHFDAFSIHPYTSGAPLKRLPARYARSSLVQGVPLVRRVLQRHGDAAKTIWLTEFGWSTCGLRNQPEPWQNCVSEKEQARFVVQVYRKIAAWTYVPVAILYGCRDRGGDPNEREEHFGLLSSDGRPKPAYWAFSAAMDRLLGSRATGSRPRAEGASGRAHATANGPRPGTTSA